MSGICMVMKTEELQDNHIIPNHIHTSTEFIIFTQIQGNSYSCELDVKSENSRRKFLTPKQQKQIKRLDYNFVLKQL